MNPLDTKIKITFNEDYRGVFKKDQTINIPTLPMHIIYLVGPNGCGKSTLLRAIRSTNDTLEKFRRDIFDGCRSPKVENVTNDIKVNKLTVTGTEKFSHIFAFDVEADDNTNGMNAASAYAFVAGGGHAALRQSRGQNVTIQFARFMREFEKVANEHMQDEDWHPLVIIDEVDEGLDIRMQLRWNQLITSKFCFKGATVLVVSHNPVCMLSESPLVKAFDVVEGNLMDRHDYIRNLTGCDITIDYSGEKSWEEQTKFNREHK